MAFSMAARSARNLVGVHEDLRRVIEAAALGNAPEFLVIEGLRTLARQQQLVAAGASRTLNSRHLTGHAVDVAPIIGGQVRWDWPAFYPLAAAIKEAAAACGVPVEWGGDWQTFKDGPHFQLPESVYPPKGK